MRTGGERGTMCRHVATHTVVTGVVADLQKQQNCVVRFHIVLLIYLRHFWGVLAYLLFSGNRSFRSVNHRARATARRKLKTKKSAVLSDLPSNGDLSCAHISALVGLAKCAILKS